MRRTRREPSELAGAPSDAGLGTRAARRASAHRRDVGSPTPGPLRIAGAVLTGLAVAAVVVVLRTSHILEHGYAIAFAVALLLAIPTSGELARRLFINGSLVVGWCVVTWWVDVSPSSIGRVTAALAIASGMLAGWTQLGGSMSRVRLLVPRGRPVDVLPLGAVLWISLRLRGRLLVANPHDALAMALGGYDNIGHFDMVNMLRLHGATIDRLAPPGAADRWAYDTYPQSFHAVTASIIELLHSAEPSTPPVELMRYTQGTALTEAVVVALLLLGICGLPRLRTNAVVALPVVAFTTAALFVGPGSVMIVDGYHNFFFGCVAIALLIVAALQIPRPTSVLHLTVIGGLLVAVAHAWLPLLVLAGPAALIIIWPMGRRRWRASRRDWVLVIVVLVATIGAMARAVALLGTLISAASDVLNIGSRFATPPASILVLSAVGASACCLLVGARRGSSRVIALAAVPAVGGLTLAGIARSELASTGELGYYFSKFVYAEHIVSLTLVAVVLGTAFARSRKATTARTRARHLVGSVLLGGALFQAFGSGAWHAMPSELATYTASPVVDHLLRAGEYLAEHRETPVTYLSLSDDQFGDPVRAAFWAMAIAGRHTYATMPLTGVLTTVAADDENLVAAIPRLLDTAPDRLVLVSPEKLEFARQRLDPSQAQRVVSW